MDTYQQPVPVPIVRLGLLSIIETDLCENEEWILQLGAKSRGLLDLPFAGERDCVFKKIPYVPPCHPFEQLRELILQVQEATGLRAGFYGIVALDMSEWLGKTREEYFTILLKYLYDHRNNWYAAMVIPVLSARQRQEFITQCAVYMTPRLIRTALFEDKGAMEQLLMHLCIQKGCCLTEDAAACLAENIRKRTSPQARSLNFLHRILEELLENRPSQLKEVHIREYLSHSLLNCLDGREEILIGQKQEAQYVQL